MTTKISVWNNPYLAYEFYAEVELPSGLVLYKRNLGQKCDYTGDRTQFDESRFLPTKDRVVAFLPWVSVIEKWESMNPGEICIDGFRWTIKFYGDTEWEIGGTNQKPEQFDEFISALEDLLQKEFSCGPDIRENKVFQMKVEDALKIRDIMLSVSGPCNDSRLFKSPVVDEQGNSYDAESVFGWNKKEEVMIGIHGDYDVNFFIGKTLTSVKGKSI